MPAKKKNKTNLTDTTLRDIDKDDWAKFETVCDNADSNRSVKLRRYIKRCAEKGEVI